jgi:hypothetical protein
MRFFGRLRKVIAPGGPYHGRLAFDPDTDFHLSEDGRHVVTDDGGLSWRYAVKGDPSHKARYHRQHVVIDTSKGAPMSDILTANLSVRNDPWYQICLRAQQDKRFERVRDEIIEGRRAMEEGRMVYNMDGGPYFHDTRAQSIITAPCTSVTGASTDKLLWPGSLTAVPAGYFTAGKKLRLTAWVSVTTGVTPANGGIELYVGSADAGGTLVASSAAFALVGSQSTMPFLIVAYLKCNGGAVETRSRSRVRALGGPDRGLHVREPVGGKPDPDHGSGRGEHRQHADDARLQHPDEELGRQREHVRHARHHL